MDIVYVVRPGEKNPELRYSLRSLVNIPHGRVWIAGFGPSWVEGVETIPVAQRGTKYQNSTANLRAACEHPDMPDEFLLFNDDFFVMHPVDEMPVLHRGPMDAAIEYHTEARSDVYVKGMKATRRLLLRLGHASPLSYELHVPLPIRRDLMLLALEQGSEIPVLHKRTLYGNLAGLGGTQVVDCKVRSRRDTGWMAWTFLSTWAPMWRTHPAGRFIRERFSQPSAYETTLQEGAA